MGDRGEDRVDRTALPLTNQMLLRATELFAEEGRKLREGLLLKEGRCGLHREKGAVGGRERGKQQIRWRYSSKG